MLSGSTTGKVHIWNARMTLPPSPEAVQGDQQIIVENRYPIYELNFKTEDVSLVHGDWGSSSIYNSSENQIIYRWDFHDNHKRFEQYLTSMYVDHIPKCEKIVNTEYSSSSQCHNSAPVFKLSMRRPTIFANESSSTSQVGSVSAPSVLSSNSPFTSITNWINNCQDSRVPNNNSTEHRAKRQKTSQSNLELSSNSTYCTPQMKENSASDPRNTSLKNSSKSRRSKSSRKSLFLNNRKISEFFTP